MAKETKKKGKRRGGKLRSEGVRRSLYSKKPKKRDAVENERIKQLRELTHRVKSIGQLSTLLLSYFHEKATTTEEYTTNTRFESDITTIAEDLDLARSQVRDICEIFHALRIIEMTDCISVTYCCGASDCAVLLRTMYQWVKQQDDDDKLSETIVSKFFSTFDFNPFSIYATLTIKVLLILIAADTYQHFDTIVALVSLHPVGSGGLSFRDRTRRIKNIADVFAQNGAVLVSGKQMVFNYEVIIHSTTCFDPIPIDVLSVAANDAQVYATRKRRGSLNDAYIMQIAKETNPSSCQSPVRKSSNHLQDETSTTPGNTTPLSCFIDHPESPLYISQRDVADILNGSICATAANRSVCDLTCREEFKDETETTTDTEAALTAMMLTGKKGYEDPLGMGYGWQPFEESIGDAEKFDDFVLQDEFDDWLLGEPVILNCSVWSKLDQPLLSDHMDLFWFELNQE